VNTDSDKMVTYNNGYVADELNRDLGILASDNVTLAGVDGEEPLTNLSVLSLPLGYQNGSFRVTFVVPQDGSTSVQDIVRAAKGNYSQFGEDLNLGLSSMEYFTSDPAKYPFVGQLYNLGYDGRYPLSEVTCMDDNCEALLANASDAKDLVRDLNVTLPSFMIESEHMDLMSALSALNADAMAQLEKTESFPNILEGMPVGIAKIEQSARLAISDTDVSGEAKTVIEMTGATAVATKFPPTPPQLTNKVIEFHGNRPMLTVVSEATNGNVLFLAANLEKPLVH